MSEQHSESEKMDLIMIDLPQTCPEPGCGVPLGTDLLDMEFALVSGVGAVAHCSCPKGHRLEAWGYGETTRPTRIRVYSWRTGVSVQDGG